MGDICDNCYSISNPDQNDYVIRDCPTPPYASDPICGDACADVDEDGLVDADDTCPFSFLNEPPILTNPRYEDLGDGFTYRFYIDYQNITGIAPSYRWLKISLPEEDEDNLESYWPGNGLNNMRFLEGSGTVDNGTYYLDVPLWVGTNYFIFSFDDGYLCNTISGPFEGPTVAPYTLYVPDDYPTIQEAIDASGGRNTIIVRDGRYTEHVNVGNKGIILRSENGPANCIIDGGGTIGTVLKVIYGVIDGFQIENEGGYCGLQLPSGAIRLSDEYLGGGIAIDQSQCGGPWGYSAPCTDSGPTVTNCIIKNNSCYLGGGIFIHYHVLGVPLYVNINNCILTGNAAYMGSHMGLSHLMAGGAIFISGSQIETTISDCIISGNKAGDAGGGIFVGEAWDQLTTKIINSTFYGNIISDPWGTYEVDIGGAIAFDNDIDITNSVFWENRGPYGEDNISPYYPYSDATASLHYCDIGGGIPTQGVVCDAGCIDADPLFTSPGYWDDNGTPEYPQDDFWINGDGDYHLQGRLPMY